MYVHVKGVFKAMAKGNACLTFEKHFTEYRVRVSTRPSHHSRSRGRTLWKMNKVCRFQDSRLNPNAWGPPRPTRDLPAFVVNHLHQEGSVYSILATAV